MGCRVLLPSAADPVGDGQIPKSTSFTNKDSEESAQTPFSHELEANDSVCPAQPLLRSQLPRRRAETVLFLKARVYDE